MTDPSPPHEDLPEQVPAAVGVRKAGGWRSRALPVLLLTVAAVFVVVALWRNWSGVRADLALLSWVDLLGSGLAAAVALVLTALAWRVLLSGLGAQVPVRPALRVFCVGQLGKYVPGSVWVVAIQAELGRQYGVRRTVMALSYLVTVMVSIATGGLIGLFALLGSASQSTRVLAPILAVGGGLVVLGLLRPGLINAGLRWGAARLGREVPEIELSARSLAAAMALTVLGWVAFGLHAWLLARPVGGDGGLFLPTVGAFALGFVAGLVLIPLPAGAGVREGVLVAILAGPIGTPSALTVALVSRLLLVVVDVVLAASFGLAGGRGAGVREAHPPASGAL